MCNQKPYLQDLYELFPRPKPQPRNWADWDPPLLGIHIYIHMAQSCSTYVFLPLS